MKTTKEILVEARGYIAEPGSWTQGVHARNKRGHAVEIASSKATCWCAVGAIVKTGALDSYKALDALAETIGNGRPIHVPSWNDAPNRTHAEVLAAFGRAIEMAGAE